MTKYAEGSAHLHVWARVVVIADESTVTEYERL